MSHALDAADALLHPVALAAVALLLLNDHVLKAAWPGPVTGKLSDVAGLAFFPILLLSAWEVLEAIARRWRRPTRRALLLAVGLTAAGFALVKTVPWAAGAFGGALGCAQWLLALPVRALVGLPPPPIAAATVVVDPTDLLALPALGLALWVGATRLARAEAVAVRPDLATPTTGRTR